MAQGASCAACSGTEGCTQTFWKVDVRLPRKGNSNSHGARPVHLIITMIKWIRTSRLSIKNYLSGTEDCTQAWQNGNGVVPKTALENCGRYNGTGNGDGAGKGNGDGNGNGC